MTNDPIKVVVADDQPIIRNGFADVLDSAADITVVGRASNGEELIHLMRSLSPDVAVVDIRMPVMDGITATSHISGRCKVLMLTTFDLHDYVLSSLAAGARGFLLKDVPAPRLLDAVHAIADGSLLLGRSVTDQLVQDLAQRKPQARKRRADVGLTPREGEVLGLMAAGMSNREIAAQLVITPETVKSHVSEILRKLALRDRVQAVVYAYREGLVEPR